MSGVSLVDDGAALLSMRNSDFDAYSAIGEVIDNSIQAAAKNIRLQITFQQSRQEPIISVAFGDDGIGMSSEILHRCLQLGYSTRFNDRSGIGRFGVGATLAAINQCRKMEVCSKEKSGDWLYTYIDLELITSDPPKMTEIPSPTKKAITNDLSGLVGSANGTLVIWSKYDRQPEPAGKMIEELHVWVGRTYRKFIWDGVKIFINGDLVRAVDPLYVNTALTKFPDDARAHEYKEIALPWPVAHEDRRDGGPTEAMIRIRMSLLPKSFRPVQGSGNTKQSKERYIDRNEGVSILRNGREVYYDVIPWWPGTPFKEIDRWWGCEIAFDAILDSQFTVKNIKRGAIPVKELKQAICDKITPTRDTALEQVRSLWKEAEAAARSRDIETGVDTGHSDAEKAAKDTPTPKNVIDKGKSVDEEARKLTDQLLKNADEQQKALWRAKFKSQPFTIVDDQWKGPEFVETNHLGGVDVLKYNMQHAFFAEIAAIRTALASGDPEELKYSQYLSALIDLLLISYSKAEAMFDKDLELRAEKFIEQLRMSWGNYLANYIETWKKGSEASDHGQ
jgi:polyhydroxyalkanoate synthesis regulator phasin